MLADAQAAGEQTSPIELIDTSEIETPIRTVPKVDSEPTNLRQPITEAELEEAYGTEALSIVNEQLRREIELLAREYRESERRNEIQLFGLGAIVALIFLGIGFAIGKRFGGRRLL
ncbi:MAG: hypothetical protein OXG05_01375 [Gammaproteobacteria bacterium]|nr:hypothetical protein [Gammaproteobacteria bacterium]